MADGKYLDFETLQHIFNTMPLPKDKIQAEYVWIGGSGMDLRSKTRTLDISEVKSLADLPEWNYDGSSTGQAPGHHSDVVIKARAWFKDPFRGGNNVLVMCDTYDMSGTPIPTNTRFPAQQIFDKVADKEYWFGIEQEYTILQEDGRTPFGWPRGGFPGPQGPYYCSAGTANAYGRCVPEALYRACLAAGVKIAGQNAEVMPGQWEYQIGPCLGISVGDHMWMSRYILHRVSEIFRVVVSFDPKPIDGDWNGAGCHTNVSTKEMREEGGLKAIYDAMPKLQAKHQEHIEVYGKGNERRLTGRHETQSIHKFSFGVADRGSSIRIPFGTAQDGKGYFEDRRPASNCDPYTVASKIAETVSLS